MLANLFHQKFKLISEPIGGSKSQFTSIHRAKPEIMIILSTHRKTKIISSHSLDNNKIIVVARFFLIIKRIIYFGVVSLPVTHGIISILNFSVLSRQSALALTKSLRFFPLVKFGCSTRSDSLSLRTGNFSRVCRSF